MKNDIFHVYCELWTSTLNSNYPYSYPMSVLLTVSMHEYDVRDFRIRFKQNPLLNEVFFDWAQESYTKKLLQ